MDLVEWFLLDNRTKRPIPTDFISCCYPSTRAGSKSLACCLSHQTAIMLPPTPRISHRFTHLTFQKTFTCRALGTTGRICPTSHGISDFTGQSVVKLTCMRPVVLGARTSRAIWLESRQRLRKLECKKVAAEKWNFRIEIRIGKIWVIELFGCILLFCWSCGSRYLCFLWIWRRKHGVRRISQGQQK